MAIIVLDPLVGPIHYIMSIKKMQSTIKGDDIYAVQDATKRKAENNRKNK